MVSGMKEKVFEAPLCGPRKGRTYQFEGTKAYGRNVDPGHGKWMSMSMAKKLATVNTQSPSCKRSQRSMKHRIWQQDPTLTLVNSKGDAIAWKDLCPQ